MHEFDLNPKKKMNTQITIFLDKRTPSFELKNSVVTGLCLSLTTLIGLANIFCTVDAEIALKLKT